MQEKTIKTYGFEELDEEAKKKAIENNRNINVDGSFWYDYILEEFTRETEEIGFDIDSEAITFSVMSREAHFGVRRKEINTNENLLEEAESFYVEFSDLPKKVGYFYSDFPFRTFKKTSGEALREVQLIELWKNGNCIIPEEDDSIEAIVKEEYYNKQEEKVRDKFYDLIELCKKYHKRLREEYEYQMNDEAVAETLKINDYEFTENGKQKVRI